MLMGDAVPELGVSGFAIVNGPIVSGISMSIDADERLPGSSCTCADGGGTRLLSLRGSAYSALSGRSCSFVGDADELRFSGSAIGLLRNRLIFFEILSSTLERRVVFSADALSGGRDRTSRSRSCESREALPAACTAGGAVAIRPRFESLRLMPCAFSAGTSSLSGDARSRSRSPRGVTGAELALT